MLGVCRPRTQLFHVKTVHRIHNSKIQNELWVCCMSSSLDRKKKRFKRHRQHTTAQIHKQAQQTTHNAEKTPQHATKTQHPRHAPSILNTLSIPQHRTHHRQTSKRTTPLQAHKHIIQHTSNQHFKQVSSCTPKTTSTRSTTRKYCSLVYAVALATPRT